MFLLSQSIWSLLGPPGAQRGTTKAQGGLVESPWEDQGGQIYTQTPDPPHACGRLVLGPAQVPQSGFKLEPK